MKHPLRKTNRRYWLSFARRRGKTNSFVASAEVPSTGIPSAPVYTPVAMSSPSAPASASSTPCTEEQAAHPTAPAPVYPAVPEASKEAYPAAPKPKVPAPKPEVPAPKPVVPVESKQVYPTAPAPASSTSCTEEQVAHSTAPAPVYPAVPVASKEASPPAPAPVSSTSCTEEQTAHPTAPAPAYPAVPVTSKEAYPAAPKPEVPAPKPYSPALPKPEVPASKPVSSAQVYPTKSAEPSKPTGSYGSGGRIKTNGNKWAITYTPYANNGQCKSQDEVKDDIKKISSLGFTTIRSYSTDCGVFENVVPECQKYGLKVIYGIFLEGAGKGTFSQHAEDQLNDIKGKAPKDSVAMVIVGNECMSNNNCQPAELASYIDHVRDELRGAGFPQDIAVTTTETVGTWEEKGAALCDHIDVFAVQVQPYFTKSTSPEDAGDFAAEQLEQAAKVCPGAAAKGKYITEIGWPSAGMANGKAVAGQSEQKIALQKIQEKVGSKACMFSFQNDGWKPSGAFNVEQYFGLLKALF